MIQKDVNEVIKLELKLLKKENRKSGKIFEKYLSDDFIELAQDGKKYNKQDIVYIVPTCPEENITSTDFESKIISENTILLTYKIDRAFVISKEKRQTLCSSIWQKRNDIWKMIFFQGSNVDI